MERSEIERELADAIDVESKVGIPWWPGVEMAPIAYRRVVSYARRHKRKRATRESCNLDLAKGLKTHFESGVDRTPLTEWLHLANILTSKLEAINFEADT